MIRSFRRSPALFATIVATLAIGVAACTTLFSVLHGVLAQRLPFPDAESLLYVNELTRTGESGASFRAYTAWQGNARSIARIGAVVASEVTMTGIGEPARLHVGRVTPDLLPMLGAVPLIGRTFVPEDNDPSSAPVAVLSHALWKSQFQGRKDVLGQTVVLDRIPHEIIGVLRPGFDFPNANTDVWTAVAPAYAPVLFAGGTGFLQVIVRPKPGLEPAVVESEFRRIEDAEHANIERGDRIAAHVVPLREHLAGDLEQSLLLLLLAGVLVLAVCCANVATLLLMRGIRREQEFAMRRALGASNVRVLSEVLREGAAIMGVACGAGLALAWISIAAARPFIAAEMPPYASIRLDGTVLVAGLLAALITTAFASIAPVLHATHVEINRLIGNGGARSGESPRSKRARDALVVGELALTMSLLVAAGLVTKSFVGLARRSLGLDADHVLAGLVSWPVKNVMPWQRAEIIQFTDEVTRRLDHEPGVLSTAIASSLPSTGNTFGEKIATTDGREVIAGTVLVSPEYFAALGIPLKRGRLLTPDDGGSGADTGTQYMPAVLSETLARRLFPARDPIGATISTDGPLEHLDVVGIVGDARQAGMAEPAPLVVYAPFRGMPTPGVYLLVRATRDPRSVIPRVQAVVRDVDPLQTVTRLQPLSEVFARSIVRPRLYFALLLATALAAIIVAGVGVYAVVEFSLRQRRLEMGIRAAFGATAGRMMRLVLLDGVKLGAAGIAIGSGLAWVSSQLLTSVLVGVQPADPTVFVGAAAGVMCVAIVGSLVPARSLQELQPARIMSGGM